MHSVNSHEFFSQGKWNTPVVRRVLLVRWKTVRSKSNIHFLKHFYHSRTQLAVPLSYQRLVDEIRIQYCTSPFQSMNLDNLSRVNEPVI